MAKEPRPKGYPKLKNYKPSQFMLPTSHYDKNAYSARTAHPFRRNGAPFRFKLSKAQLVD